MHHYRYFYATTLITLWLHYVLHLLGLYLDGSLNFIDFSTVNISKMRLAISCSFILLTPYIMEFAPISLLLCNNSYYPAATLYHTPTWPTYRLQSKFHFILTVNISKMRLAISYSFVLLIPYAIDYAPTPLLLCNNSYYPAATLYPIWLTYL
jgi:hypothetical protein